MCNPKTTWTETRQIRYPEHGFVGAGPADRWEDGMIVGNGAQGALCFSRPHREEIVLSHESLFLPIYPKHDYMHLAPHLDHSRELILANRGAEAMRLTMDLAKQKGYPSRELTDPFIGACSLMLDMPASACTAYARSVNFETGEALVAWEDEAGRFHRRVFASRADGVVAIELKSPHGALCNVSLELARIERDLDHDLYARAVDDTTHTVDENFLGFTVKLRTMSDEQQLRGYSVGMRVVSTGGRRRVAGRRLNVQDAERVLLLIEVRPSTTVFPVEIDDLRERLQGITPAYEALRDAHAAIHAALFHRVTLALCDKTEEQVATEELQEQSAAGNTNRALIQKAFEAGRYGTICSTGVLPPALQGIWTGTWRPRWSGDFTLNGNVQSAVAAALPGNHAECMRATLDYLSGLLDDFRTNARELFNFRGIYVPWRGSTHGQCHYAGGGRGDGSNAFPGMYWFAGTAWWAWFYYDYWLYTGDDDFFATQLTPFFMEAAAFYEDYLGVERDGELVLVPSYSPENRPADQHGLQPNATMTIACIRQLFRTLLRIGNRMGIARERQDQWRAILVRLPVYRVDPSGALAEWAWPSATNNENHRHASHLYPLFDGVAPEIEADPALREACRVAIEKRLQYRRGKQGAEMAFGLVQLGMAATYLRDKALAYECVEWLVNSYWSPAMVSQHDPGEILNLDISGGLPAVIMNMLVQSFEPEQPGGPWQLSLLPCLPAQWPSGSIEGVRCRGGFEVALQWTESMVTELAIKSLRGEPCTVEYNGHTVSPEIVGAGVSVPQSSLRLLVDC